ncbi:MAG: EamA family transporter, partial [Clostridiales bacterium]|nr:EamA family transporter [Clostridiales bacterium]
GFLIQLIPGFIVYMIGAIFMIMAFRFGELSVLQPMNSMSYVFSLILAVGILHETVTPFMIIGVILIMIGVFFIGGSSK